MKVIACLNWYDESPAWLTRAVAGVGRFADHLVAVDGAYAHLPGALKYPRSPGHQAEAILAAADGCGMGVTIHQPTTAWLGDEVAKRSFVFRAGNLAAEPGEDWLYLFDADEMIVDVPEDLRDQLRSADLDVGGVEWFERTTDQAIPGDDPYADRFWQALTVRSEQSPIPKFFRADPTLRVEAAHYVYAVGPADAPRYLWGNRNVHEIEPSFAISGMRFEHWSRLRQPARRRRQANYYEVRDHLGLESLKPAELADIPEVAHV